MCECYGNPLASVTLAPGLPSLLVNRPYTVSSISFHDFTNLMLRFRTKRLDGIWEYLHNHEKPSDVYSFVCNAMMNVCNCQSSERCVCRKSISSAQDSHQLLW